MFYIIYKTTNLVNGKFYIGKHQTTILNDGYMGSGKLLRRAIKKYGVDNFNTEILYSCKTEKEMNTLEKILVVPDPDLNYNLCPGGHGGFGYINIHLKDEMNMLKSKLQKSQPNSYYSELGRRAASKSSARMKQKHADGAIIPPNWTGKKHTEETKQKMRKSKNVGSSNPNYGTTWITNGLENKKIKKEVDIIPEGWYKGRTMVYSTIG